MAYVIKIKYEGSLRRMTIPISVDGGLSFHVLEARIRELLQLPTSVEFVVTYSDKDSDTITMTDDHDLTDALVHQSLNPLRLNVTLKSDLKSKSDSGTVEKEDLVEKDLVEKEAATHAGMDIQFLEKAGVDIQLFENFKNTMNERFASQPEVLSRLNDYLNPKALCEGRLDPYGIFQSFVQTILGHRVDSNTSDGADAVSSVASSDGGLRDGGRASTTIVHDGIVCDVCGICPIVGLRWKANNHFDYDLCSNCFEKFGNINEFTKVDQPMYRPRHLHKAKQIAHPPRIHPGISCDMCGVNPIVGIRWKANKRWNYDLCGTCFEKTGNANVNDYTKIEQHVFRNRHLHKQPMRAFSGHPMGFPNMGRPMFNRGRVPFGNRPGYDAVQSSFYGRCTHAGRLGKLGLGKLDARFVCDVTIFDGTEVAPGTHFTKIWRLRNSGDLPWPKQTKLVHIGGDELGETLVPLEMPLDLAPQKEIEVSVDLIAPQQPGRYVSHWRLAAPHGPRFGHRVWVFVQVVPSEIFSPAAETGVAPAIIDAPEVGETGVAPAILDAPEVGETGVAPAIIDAPEVGETGVAPPAVDAPEVGETGVTPAPIDMPEVAELLGAAYLEQIQQLRSGKSTEAGGGKLTSHPTIQALPEVAAPADTSKRDLVFDPLSPVNWDVNWDVLTVERTTSGGFEGVGAPNAEVDTIGQAEEDPNAGEKSVAGAGESPQIEKYNAQSAEASIANAAPAIPEYFSEEEKSKAGGKSVAGELGELPQVENNVFESTEVPVVSVEAGRTVDVESSLAKLKMMGFSDEKVNLEILEKNEFNLKKTLEDLFTVEEWDPIMEELEEMGFYDSGMNRRLMFKNNGSVKRVVKDLVELDKTGSSKGKQVVE